MADAVIGALRVILGADTAAFSEGLKKANKDLDNFNKGFKIAAAAAAAAMLTAGAAIGVAVKHTIDQADQLGKMAQKFGVPVEELSKLKFAADLSDVSLESLGKGLGKLSKALTDAAANPAGEAAKAFNALGVAVRNSDGSVKSSEQALLDIAEKFATLKDGAGKTASSIALFGRAGADLIPLLNQGKTGIQALKDEAEKLGIVVSAKTAKSAEEFNDNMKRLGTITSAVALQITEAMLPKLEELSTSLVNVARNGSLLKSTGELIGTVFNTLVEIIATTALSFHRLGIEFGLFVEAARLFFAGTPQQFRDAFAAFVAAGQETVTQLALLKLAFNGINHETDDLVAGFKQLATGIQQVNKPLNDINFGALGAKSALDSFLSSQAKSVAATNAHAQTIGAAAGAQERWKVILEAYAIAAENGITVTAALAARISQAGIAAETAAQKVAAGQFIQGAISEFDQLGLKISEIQMLMDKFPDKAAGLQKAMVQIAQQQQAMLLGTFEAFAAGFSQLFMAFGKQNKQMFQIGQAFAIAQALINTYLAVTKALSAYPPPFSYVAAAGALAAGLAQVVNIKAQKFTAAALGGSFKVPGGVSGFDSRLVPMMLSPGERVDVTPASRVGEGSRELIIPSIKPKDFFTGETVREMVLSIDQWMRDGGTGIRLAT